MFCPQCGKKNENEALFCFNCGAKIEDIDGTAAYKLPPETTSTSAAAENSSEHELLDLAKGEDAKAENASTNGPDKEAPTVHRTGSQEAKVNAPSKQAGAGRAFKTAFTTSAEGAVKAASSTLGNKRRIVAIAGAAIAIIAAALIWFNVTGAGTLGQTQETFKQAFSLTNTVTKGIASNRYVNESPYSIADFKCESIKKANDYEVVADIRAVIENDNFRTEITARGEYHDVANMPSYLLTSNSKTENYDFDITSSSTTPKKGIDYDSNHGLSNCQSSLSEDALSCTVETESQYSYWFAESTDNHVYHYAFNGTTWSFTEDEDVAKISYKKDIEGSYRARTGTPTNIAEFTISNVDTEKGTFVVTYVVNQSTSAGAETVSGTLNATIDPSDKHVLASTESDKLTYHFTGKGTSDSGDQQAAIEGQLTTGVSGEPLIRLEAFEADYSSQSFVMSTAQNRKFLASGDMYKL